jgi:MinD superfamily P-loop ATPase
MKQLVIVSGKGGTGKTVLTASFAALSRKAVLADLDVDAANLHLLLHPEVRERHLFQSGQKARIDPSLCDGCGRCRSVCRFDALVGDDDGRVRVDPFSCEGCGVCYRVCPVGAVSLDVPTSGEWFESRTRYGPFVHGRLGVAEENSGKLVSELRKAAQAVAAAEGRDLLIMDGSPGIGCPVIASLTGTDLALIVTEPTLSGLHDLARIAELIRHFNIRPACCVNKHDLSRDAADGIEAWCAARSIPVLGRIPFDPAVTESVVRGAPFVEYASNATAAEIRRIWDALLGLMA